MPYRVRSVKVTTERGDFAALEAQPGHGVCERRPAVLVPGFTGSKEASLRVLEPLAAADRTVVAMDLRGQYQSPQAPDRGGYAPGEMAADVMAVADAVSRDSAASETGPHGSAGVHLVGHSMGGLIARDAALLQTGRVLSLTLLGSGPGAIGGRPCCASCWPSWIRMRAARATTATSSARSSRRCGGTAWSRRLGWRARMSGSSRSWLSAPTGPARSAS